MNPGKKIKILAVIFILGGGMAGSYFIIKNSVQAGATEEKTGQKQENSIDQNPIKWIKDNVGNALGKVNELSQSILGNSSGQTQSEGNLTESLGKIIFEQIKSKNEQGLTEKSGQSAIFAANEDALSQEWLDNFLGAGSSGKVFGSYHPKVDEKRFVISRDSSSDGQIRYIKELEKISAENFVGFDKTSDDVLKDIAEKKDSSSAVQLAGIYGKIAEDSYKVSIPGNWVNFHKAFLSHFYSAQSLWLAIGNFQNDPLRAYLSLQYVPNLEDSAKGLEALLAKGVIENNLKL